MANRQYQIPGGPYINAAQDGREYQLPGFGYFNDETSATFDSALMAAIGYNYPDKVYSKPSIVASGMTPPNFMPN